VIKGAKSLFLEFKTQFAIKRDLAAAANDD
jgi:hypothetical protein